MQQWKKLPVQFYHTGSGEEPVRTWLLRLDKVDRRIIGVDIQKVEFGWPIGLPLCRPLGNGLWEVRSSISGNRIARIIFGTLSGTLILLHGFIKKTEKTPQQDLQLALDRLKEIHRKSKK